MFGLFKKASAQTKSDVVGTKAAEGYAYVIGDIHGCYDELCELLELIESDAKSLTEGPIYIVFLGDLMDRGPKSNEVIEHLRTFNPDYAKPIFLMGNHEEVFLKVLSGSISALTSWFDFGGRECVRSYGVTNLGEILMNPENLLFRIQEAVPQTHVDFMEGFDETFQFGPYLCVHAGIKPRVAIEKQSTRDLRWIRKEFMAYEKPHPFVIVHGHTIVERADIRPNRIAVDTGTYEGGPLTAVRLSRGDPYIIETASKTD